MEGPWKLPLRFRDMEHFNPIIISKRSEAIAASAQKFSKSLKDTILFHNKPTEKRPGNTLTDRSESEPQGLWDLPNLNRPRGTGQSKDRSESEAQKFPWPLPDLNRRGTGQLKDRSRHWSVKQWKKNQGL
ncbi:hypothetical protein TEA_011576 [Camellia sinensis var. sinensis]|uniref:Uncharacterized protein n=1 Tax=Camellia sinensis var. sinensis TaxID=542762 RepID=A0A4S4D308_CAMSN|nr:hypothetical protein TEA_011576 [Camellia sinensis var. sinensis]